MKYWSLLLSAVFVIASFLFAYDFNEIEFIDKEEARSFPGFQYQGEYTGEITFNETNRQTASLQVAVHGENQFKALFIANALPGHTYQTIDEDEMYELEGAVENGNLILSGDHPLSFRYDDGSFTAINDENEVFGQLEYTERMSPANGMYPPENAIILFDGSNLDHWDENTRMTEDGLLIQGATTAEEYGDMRLHLEAKIGFMPKSTTQGRANSGVYIQNRYEVQILDSFALPPQIFGNASLYNEYAPRINTSLPPLAWQAYDIFFRAPRFDDAGNKTENARFTVYLNGILVHDDIELESGTGVGGQREEVAAAPLYLQDHTGPVRFRNVWLVEDDVTPPGTLTLEP